MELSALKKLTVIAEALLRDRLVNDLKAQGVRGYSLSRVEGEGTRHFHASDFEGDNVQIESIVSPDIAEKVLEHLKSHYFEDFSIIAYTQDVQVLRKERFE
jgi:nitrogen regulatory protein P-II 2